MQEKIFELLVKKDEVTWQTIIYDLVRSEELNPWNIDISLLAKRYREIVQKLQGHNFFVSGKVLLASAILLKMKSDKLLHEYIAEFDSQLYPKEEELLGDMEEDYKHVMRQQEYPPLLVKTPQQRKRQITLNDLMKALEKALEVDERRRIRRIFEEPVIQEAVMPERTIDISSLIKSVYEKILGFFSRKEKVTFTRLLDSDSKQDKIQTFIPLLHLCNQQKIDLHQEVPFGEIEITVMDEPD